MGQWRSQGQPASSRNLHQHTSRKRPKNLLRGWNAPAGLEPLESRQMLSASVVISEIMYNPSLGNYGDAGYIAETTSREYVEVYNRGDAPVNLEGWKLKQGISFTFPNVTLNPGEYLAVSPDLAAFYAAYPSVSNVVGAPVLVPRGAPARAVVPTDGSMGSAWTQPAFDDSAWKAGFTGVGYETGTGYGSYIGLDLGAEMYGVNSSAYIRIPFNVSDPAQLDGLMLWMQYEDAFVAYINGQEVMRQNTPKDLTWNSAAAIERVDGRATVFEDLDLSAHVDKLVAGENVLAIQLMNISATNSDLLMTPELIGGRFGKLSNSGEDIELEDAAGKRVDFVSVGDDGDWSVRRPGTYTGFKGWEWVTTADGGKSSIELINPMLGGEHAQNWAASTVAWGTPGAANSVAAVDVAPLILDVGHYPLIPKSTQTVTITARLRDELGSGAMAFLHHRVDGQTAFNAAPMYDDGLHGDGLAGDGLFGAVLPARPHGTIVEFYVESRDLGGNTRTWPGPTDNLGTQGANLLYQVDDTIYSGSQPIYRLIIPAAELAQWTATMNGGGSASDAQMNATFISIEGDSVALRYNAGVRNRGMGSRNDQPHNYHLSFTRDNAWKGFYAVNLNTQYTHAQAVGNALFQLAGLPAPDGTQVVVHTNGVNLANPSQPQFGSYFRFEPYNAQWAEAHLPEDSSGNLYKGVSTGSPDADLRYISDDPASYRMSYFKQSNTAEDDWYDLIRLVKALNPATPAAIASYANDVRAVVNVEEWLTFFVVNSLIGNRENSIGGTGGTNWVGDDYSMYSGVEDPRFMLLIHDMDTILGQGDTAPNTNLSLFPTANLPTIDRLLKHPEFVPLYFQIYLDQMATTFAPGNFNPFIDHMLGGWVPASTIQAMKDFVVSRNAGVLAQIPRAWSVTTAPAQQNGYYYTTAGSVPLAGKADAINTRRVLINGVEATWTAWKGEWSAAAVPLALGINRVLLQALDAAGNEISRYYVDVNRGATATAVSGTLPAGLTTWTLANSPYQVTGTLIVPSGATLAIEPGVTVFFASGAGITVNGQILAEGTELQRIRFTRIPGGSNWGRIDVQTGSGETRISYADIEYDSSSLRAVNSRVLLDHVIWANHTSQYLDFINSSIILSNSYLPGISSAELIHFSGMPTGGYARFEGNYFGLTSGYNDIIDLTGGQRPGPIAYFINNFFAGGGDDGLDLDATDAHIEGNVFMNFHQDGARESKSHAVSTGEEGEVSSDITVVRNLFYDVDHAILIKDGSFGTIINNTIVKVYKKIADATTSAINTYESRSGQWEGAGIYMEGNIIQDVSAIMGSADWAGHPLQIIANNNLFPDNGETVRWTGTGNIFGDAVLSNTTNVIDPRVDFRLLPGSPAIGAGPNGQDMGGLVPASASLFGLPVTLTWRNSATVRVGGPEIFGFKWRLDDGAWSEAVVEPVFSITSLTLSGTTATVVAPGHSYRDGDVVNIGGASPAEYNGNFIIRNVTADSFQYTLKRLVAVAATATGAITVRQVNRLLPAIDLSGLADGQHTLSVIIRDSGGAWQEESQAATRSWMVDSALQPRVVINEVLALNTASSHGAALPDMIELYNDGPGAVDLSGMSLTDNKDQPAKFVFPAGTVLAQGEYLVVYADSATVAGEFHAGFAIRDNGDQVYLFAPAAVGGALLDSISFGRQLADYSIGRLADGSWSLAVPTFGAANIRQGTGDSRDVRINEWLARGQVLFSDDFVELYNPASLPVDIGGFYLTDNPTNLPHQAELDPGDAADLRIKQLSFLPADGMITLIADGNAGKGADHLAFQLASELGWLALYDGSFSRIDTVRYGAQATDVSEGRTPNGGDGYAFFPLPHPGVSNPGIVTITDETTVPIFGVSDAVTGAGTVVPLFGVSDLAADRWSYFGGGVDLGTAWSATGYDDSAWATGAPVFAIEGTALAEPKRTILAGNPANTDLPYPTYYFRKHFNVSTDLTDRVLLLNVMLDDGAVIYINGNEVLRIGMNPGAVAYDTISNRLVGDATNYEGPFEIPVSWLVQGDNVIAVEVHQENVNSSDIVFAAKLDLVTRAGATGGDAWSYNDGGVDLGTAWRAAGYNDSAWAKGSPVFAVESATLSEPKRTILKDSSATSDRPYPTYYFRKHFTVGGDLSNAILVLNVMLDDGAVIYINGNEVLRIGMNTGTVTYSTTANRNVDNAVNFEGPFEIPTTWLIQGDNVIAVEVHQSGTTSSDIVWAAKLDLVHRTTTTTVTNATPQAMTDLMAGLRITEVMYQPDGGSEYEYIELRNTSNVPLDLAGVRLRGGIDFTFPARTLEPGQFVLVVADAIAFESRYGAALPVAGQYAGRLSNGGDSVILQLPNPYDAAMLRFDYRPDWHPATANAGHSLVIRDAAGAQAAWMDSAGWRASLYAGGSPAAPDQGQTPGSVIISELLSHSDLETGDWIELHNTTNEPIDISGWFISDDLANLGKFQIPDNTIIPQGGYVTFNQRDDFGVTAIPNGFGLSETGQTVYLASVAADGTPGSYRESATFGAVETNVSFGRHVTSQGAIHYVPVVSATPGEANSAIRVGPVVISEVMYNPAGGPEYIELHNASAADVPLFDPLIPANTWRFTNGIDFAFPEGVTLPAGAYMLIIQQDPATLDLALFRATYGIPESVMIFGPFANGTKLDNGGERVSLSRPGAPNAGVIPWILADAVSYGDAAPWPTQADGLGASLSRLDGSAFGDDVVNWSAELPAGSPGLENFSAAPVATFLPAVIEAGIDQISLVFQHPVIGLDAGDLVLTRNGGPNLLTAAQTLSTTDNLTWTLTNLKGLTWLGGDYELKLMAATAEVRDGAGRFMIEDAVHAFTLTTSAITGTDGDDVFMLRLNGSMLEIRNVDNPAAAPTYTAPASEVASLVIHGGAGNDTLIFDNSLPLAPVLNGGAGVNALVVRAGTYVFSQDLGADGVLNVSVGGGAALTFKASQHLGGLTVSNGGRVNLFADGSRVLRAGTLSIDGTSALDLVNNGLIVESADLDAITALIRSARISASAGSHSMGLGVMLNNDGSGNPLADEFLGEPVGLDSVLVRFTYKGDANVDGRIDGDDYFLIDTAFLRQGSGLALPPSYHAGDFDYDLDVDGSDYFLIDLSFLSQPPLAMPMAAPAPAAPPSPFASATSIVREEADIF